MSLLEVHSNMGINPIMCEQIGNLKESFLIFIIVSYF